MNLAEKWIQLKNIPKIDATSASENLEVLYQDLFEMGLFKSLELDKISSLLVDSEAVKGMAFTGSNLMKNIVAFVEDEDLKKVKVEIEQKYFKKEEDSLLVFDDISRYLMPSKATLGACYIDLRYEVWF